MKLRRVDPLGIKWPEVRVTAQFDEDLYAQFVKSIEGVGQITPIICYQVGEELWGCDGKHRADEAIKLGEAAVDVVVIPGDMVDVLTKNIFLDHLRGKTRPSEMVKVIKMLYQDYNLDPDQIREKTGLTRDYIERLIKISQASSAVVEALDAGIIGVGHAYEVSRLPYAVQQEEVIAKQQIYRFPVKEVKDLVDATLKEMEGVLKEAPPGQPAPVPTKRESKCEGCHEVVEPRYLKPVLLCPTCFGDVWRLGKAREAPEVETKEELPSP